MGHIHQIIVQSLGKATNNTVIWTEIIHDTRLIFSLFHDTRLIFWTFHATRLTPLRPSSNLIFLSFPSTLVFSRLCSQVTSCLYSFLTSVANFLHVWHFEGVIREVLEFPCSALWCLVFSLRCALVSKSNDTDSFREYATEGVFTWENSHCCDFHTGMTFWLRIAFTWWRGYFISRLFKRTVHLDKIHVRFKIAKITHTLHVLVHLQTNLTPKRVVVSRLHDTVAKFRTGV